MSPGWKNTFADAPVFYLINQIHSVSPSFQVVTSFSGSAVQRRPYCRYSPKTMNRQLFDPEHLRIAAKCAPNLVPTVAQLHPRKDVLENSAYELPIPISMDETCVTNSEQLAHFLDSLGNHAGQLARLKLALELNENAIGAV
jgi:uncharacterized protein (DUF1499 family)